MSDVVWERANVCFTSSLACGPEAETSELRSVFILCKRVLVVSCWEWILSYKSYKYSLFRNLVRMAPRGNIPQHILPCRVLGMAESDWAYSKSILGL